jgi:hypothetical protein
MIGKLLHSGRNLHFHTARLIQNTLRMEKNYASFGGMLPAAWARFFFFLSKWLFRLLCVKKEKEMNHARFISTQ